MVTAKDRQEMCHESKLVKSQDLESNEEKEIEEEREQRLVKREKGGEGDHVLASNKESVIHRTVGL